MQANLKTVYIQSNSLTMVPSMKNMRRLTFITLAFNHITSILPGDFMGATRLVTLSLGGNTIVTVAASAFNNLHALRWTPDEFSLTLDNYNNGSVPFMNAAGIGLFPSIAKKGFFGGSQDYAYQPIE